MTQLKDIRIWIVLFFLIRLISVTNPPLEVSHNWRQTTVTMVSRNFLEVDNNIFYPRVDIAGEKTGITGMEFPVMNYAIYLVSEVFGYQHWYGRLINLIVSSFGLYFFFLLIRKYFNDNMAFYATLILTCSIWFSLSRKIMPDTFSMSFILAGFYFGSNYLDSKSDKPKISELILYAFLILIGMLSKLPSGFILVLLILLILKPDILLKRKVVFVLTSFLCLIPVAIWYFYWVPYLVETFDFWHFFMGKSVSEGFKELMENGQLTLSRFYSTALKFTGFVVFIFGLTVAIIRKEKLLTTIFGLSALAFLIIMLKAGFTFSHHTYYVVPFVPIMSLIAGYGLNIIPNKKIAFGILAVVCLESTINQIQDFKIKPKNASILDLEFTLDSFSSKDDLVLINSGEYPTAMYFAHRRGWVKANHDINKTTVDSLNDKGLKYVVILKRTFGTDHSMDLPVVLDNEDFKVYSSTD